jgi:hypothetical protein
MRLLLYLQSLQITTSNSIGLSSLVLFRKINHYSPALFCGTQWVFRNFKTSETCLLSKPFLAEATKQVLTLAGIFTNGVANMQEKLF